jgi:hypothetical protein
MEVLWQIRSKVYLLELRMLLENRLHLSARLRIMWAARGITEDASWVQN